MEPSTDYTPLPSFVRSNIEWSKRSATYTIAYIYALQYANLMNMYGRRLLAHWMSGGVVLAQQFLHPNLTRTNDVNGSVPLSEMIYYRTAFDFPLALGIAALLGVTTFVVFLFTRLVIHVTQRPGSSWNPLRMKGMYFHILRDLFSNTILLTMSFSFAFWLSISGVKNLAKAIFYPDQYEALQWQTNYNIDYPGWNLLAAFVIFCIAFVLYTAAYFVVNTLVTPCFDKKHENAHSMKTITAAWMKVFRERFLRFLYTQCAFVCGSWLSFSFMPMLADGMFPYVHQYSDYQPRSRFQSQVLYEFVAVILVVMCILTVWTIAHFCLGFQDENVDTGTRNEPRKNIIPFVIGFIWAIVITFGLLITGSSTIATSFYPSNFPGELVLATCIVTLFLLIVQKLAIGSIIGKQYDIYQTLAFPLIFATAFPIAFALSNDFALSTARWWFNQWLDYPVPDNFDMIFWIQQGILIAVAIVLSFLFTTFTYFFYPSDEYSSCPCLWSDASMTPSRQYRQLPRRQTSTSTAL